MNTNTVLQVADRVMISFVHAVSAGGLNMDRTKKSGLNQNLPSLFLLRTNSLIKTNAQSFWSSFNIGPIIIIVIVVATTTITTTTTEIQFSVIRTDQIRLEQIYPFFCLLSMSFVF